MLRGFSYAVCSPFREKIRYIAALATTKADTGRALTRRNVQLKNLT